MPPRTCGVVLAGSRVVAGVVRWRTYSVDDHGRKNWPVGIVAIELPHQYRDHGELYYEDDRM